VGRVRAMKKIMDEKLQLSSKKQGNVGHTIDLVQHSIPCNIGMEI